ncbi:LOW QUALITY PROTEIN: hypothetical protein QTO34_009285 [Cnephaeus nilssonii]|uniref:DNA polymerase lambda fingers domain-containing protein n=1 Tax=Cnephaeus nilssonii TaxID=3371016 RepID=A0AA40HI97_CNENI|nr:LOW QUALITY PROTEIN: hypothetical protein QTO34_009285 [Eptesicus nilssonii]
MAKKTVGILESGHLRKLDHISDSMPVLELSLIFGELEPKLSRCGTIRSLEDIRNRASLTTQQAIGLKHYHDFLKCMPREEATEIEQSVGESAQAFNLGVPTDGEKQPVVIWTCGSLTRMAGLTRASSAASWTPRGLLTDDLVSQEKNSQQRKYLGVCQLRGPGLGYSWDGTDDWTSSLCPTASLRVPCSTLLPLPTSTRSMRALDKTKSTSLPSAQLWCGTPEVSWWGLAECFPPPLRRMSSGS